MRASCAEPSSIKKFSLDDDEEEGEEGEGGEEGEKGEDESEEEESDGDEEGVQGSGSRGAGHSDSQQGPATHLRLGEEDAALFDDGAWARLKMSLNFFNCLCPMDTSLHRARGVPEAATESAGRAEMTVRVCLWYHRGLDPVGKAQKLLARQ